MKLDAKLQNAQCKILDIIFNEVMDDKNDNFYNINAVLNVVTNITAKTLGSIFAYGHRPEADHIKLLEAFFDNVRSGSLEIKTHLENAIHQHFNDKNIH